MYHCNFDLDFDLEVDVVGIGGGAAGTIAALVQARARHDVIAGPAR